jgi:hypothetical protein
MAKRLVLAALLLALPFPAWAMTGEAACVAAIKSATAHHRAAAVPDDCWRMGPLTLGMTRRSAERILGSPLATRAAAMTYRRQKFALAETLYVYPRNLRNWLRLAPQTLDRFPPPTLRLFYWKDALVAIAAGNAGKIDAPDCKPQHPVTAFVRGGVDFPYDFHGVMLGAPLATVSQRFGRFANVNAAHETANYWPVPLAFSGAKGLKGITFATGMAFAGLGWEPDFQVQRDPQTCLVTGFAFPKAP